MNQFLYAMDKDKHNFPFSSTIFQIFTLFVPGPRADMSFPIFPPGCPLPAGESGKRLTEKKIFVIFGKTNCIEL